MIIYKNIFLIYFPIFLLLSFYILKDKFEPQKKVFKLQTWSLSLGIIAVALFLTSEIIKSLWKWLPLLKNFSYSPYNFDIFTLFWQSIILVIIFLFSHFYYRGSLGMIFNIRRVRFKFILTLCGIISVINLLAIYLGDFNLILRLRNSDIRIIESMGTGQFLLFFIISALFSPVVEELVFRGLLYIPIYRKLGPFFAVMISSFLWTYAHFEPILPSIGIFIIGVILAWLYERGESIILPTLFHIFKNSWIISYYL